jgi:carboxymethylenebutenolidase
MKLLMALDIARAEVDLRGAVDALRAHTGRPVGIVGYCMGGTLSVYAACRNGPGVGACVVFYGGHPRVSLDFDNLTAPLLGHWAENDATANVNRDHIAEQLTRRGKPFEFHTYPGTRHGYANERRPQVYDPAAAELAWRRTVSFFRTHL